MHIPLDCVLVHLGCYHRVLQDWLGYKQQELYLSQLQSLRQPGSRCKHIWYLPSAGFLDEGWLSICWVLQWSKGQGTVSNLGMKALVTSKVPLLNQPPWGQGANMHSLGVVEAHAPSLQSLLLPFGSCEQRREQGVQKALQGLAFISFVQTARTGIAAPP